MSELPPNQDKIYDIGRPPDLPFETNKRVWPKAICVNQIRASELLLFGLLF